MNTAGARTRGSDLFCRTHMQLMSDDGEYCINPASDSRCCSEIDGGGGGGLSRRNDFPSRSEHVFPLHLRAWS